MSALGPRPLGLTCEGCPALSRKHVLRGHGYWEETVTEATCTDSGRLITGRWERECPPPAWCRPALEKRAEELRREADELVKVKKP